MAKHAEVFFVIKLQNSPDSRRAIVDTDTLVASELMEGRDTFLTMCREKHWEFSSLRRATFRYSSGRSLHNSA